MRRGNTSGPQTATTATTVINRYQPDGRNNSAPSNSGLRDWFQYLFCLLAALLLVLIALHDRRSRSAGNWLDILEIKQGGTII